MKRMAGTAVIVCTAVVITAAATAPAAADFVFFKNGRIIEGEMLITPSVLQFKMTARYLDLFWAPPSFPVRSYLVYMRRGKGEFLFAGETARPGIRLKGLECGTEYTVHVTSIDGNNHESSPSNDIRFVTFAGKPRPPARLRQAGMTQEGKGYAARLVWDRAADSCGGPMKEYCVYVNPPVDAPKEKEKKKTARTGAAVPERFAGYRLAGRTAGTAFKLEGLKENVRYTVLVTSLDGSKNESGTATLAFTAAGGATPSANRRPADPFPVECRKVVVKNGQETAAQLFWKEARDPDGYVAAYRVYRKKGRSYELAGTTAGADFQVRGLPWSGTEYFVVRSVDDRGAESADSVTVTTGTAFPVTITSRFAFMVPLREFGSFFNPGYGWLIHAGIGLNSFVVGAETGYLRFTAKTDKTRETSIVPFMITASKEFPLASWISIIPGIAAGGSYSAARVAPARTLLFRVPLYRHRTAIEPLFGGGLTFLFFPMRMMVIQACVEYRGIIEAGGVADFLSFTAGAGIRF